MEKQLLGDFFLLFFGILKFFAVQNWVIFCFQNCFELRKMPAPKQIGLDPRWKKNLSLKSKINAEGAKHEHLIFRGRNRSAFFFLRIRIQPKILMRTRSGSKLKLNCGNQIWENINIFYLVKFRMYYKY